MTGTQARASDETHVDAQAAERAGCEQIATLRSRLDEINLELLALLERRGRIVQQIMTIKLQKGVAAHDPARETQMLQTLLRHARDVYPRAAVESIFQAIFTASRALAGKAHATGPSTDARPTTTQRRPPHID